MKGTLYEVRDRLAIAVAMVEAFVDGMLEPTPHRLRAVCEALAEVGGLLSETRELTQDATSDDAHMSRICTIVGDEVAALQAGRVSKLPVDSTRAGKVVKDLLMDALQRAAPGTAVVVDCRLEHEMFSLSVANDGEASTETRAQEAITVVNRPGDGATFTVRMRAPGPASTRPLVASLALVVAPTALQVR